jgi:taurine dioxygenase
VSGPAVDVSALAGAHGFGVEVTGLDSRGLSDPDAQRSLSELWLEHGLVVFRGLPDDPETHIRLSGIFGEPAHHPLKEVLGIRARPLLADVVADPERGDIVELEDGRELLAWLPWHFDLAYMTVINRGGILRPLTLPSSGGETGFIDGIAAYDRLPHELREEISGLAIRYRFDGDLAGLRYAATPGLRLKRMSVGTQALMERLDLLPEVTHPLVYSQPGTGRLVLNFSPWFAIGVSGMDQDESDRLLRRVAEVMVDERYAYYHQWRVGDMVLWDNWRLLHRACGVPAGTTRHMQRTTIAGDYGLGRASKLRSVVRDD